MSDIGAKVQELIDAGTPPAVAARIVAEAFVAGASAMSGGIPVDAAAEKRREYDRNRKRNKRQAPVESGGIPVESAECPKEALTHKTINKSKKVRASKIPCPPDWQPNEHHFAKAKELHIPESAVLSKAEDMRLWAASSGATKADWDATFHGFLRRDVDRLRVSPSSTPATAPIVPDARAIEFFAKFNKWHWDYGPEPGRPGCRASPEDLQKYGYEVAA